MLSLDRKTSDVEGSLVELVKWPLNVVHDVGKVEFFCMSKRTLNARCAAI